MRKILLASILSVMSVNLVSGVDNAGAKKAENKMRNMKRKMSQKKKTNAKKAVTAQTQG